MDAAERILQFIDYKGFGDKRKGKSLRQFYGIVELSIGTFKPGRIVGSDALKKVSDKFPDLNTDWVITERGEMLFSESKMIVGADGEAAKIAVDALKEQLRNIQADLINCYKERDVERQAKEQLQREKEELIREFTNSHLKKQQPIT